MVNVSTKDISILRTVLEAFPAKTGLDKALEGAIYFTFTEAVELLLQKGANPNAVDHFGNPLLIDAAGKGLRKVVSLFLQAGADPNLEDPAGWSPLAITIQRDWDEKSDKYLQIAHLLIKSGADVNCTHPISQETPLMWAVAKGSKELILDLIARGANLHAKSKRGNKAIVYAQNRGRKEIVKLLKKHMIPPPKM